MEVAQDPLAPSPLAALASIGVAVAEGEALAPTLGAVADAVADALGATLVVLRIVDFDGRACARGVAAASRTLAAELEGSRLPAGSIPDETLDGDGAVPEAVRETAEHIGAGALLVTPVRAGTEVVGAVEVYRGRTAFDPRERTVVAAAAAHVALAVRALGGRPGDQRDGARLIEVAGEALAAGAEHERAEAEVVRVAATAAGAAGGVMWRRRGDAAEAVAAYGSSAPDEQAALEALGGATVLRDGTVTLPIGQPPSGALQLSFPGEPPGPAALDRLGTFAARAAHALGVSHRSREAALELERTRELLALVAQANAELSLTHALEITLDRVVELVGVDRAAIYLRDEGRLETAAQRGLAGPHLPVAERLLELCLGPYRGRGALVVADAASEPALAGHHSRIAETGIEAALAVPLAVPDEVTGLLAVYPPRGTVPSAHEQTLMTAIAAQLAVAVQNARLHEQATELGTELEQVLDLERQSARQLGALYEISRSFAQSLSLQQTLDAVARTVVDLLGVDGAVIRMPDARRELLVPRAFHVADERVDAALRAILERPQRMERIPAWSAFRAGEPILLDADIARRLGPPHELLVPFLEKGSTAVILPIATPSELLGTLKLLSLDPDRPIAPETIELGLSVAAQAALAIDNARLYQHQKEFADTMQRSMLPRSRPELEGLELGDVYEPSSLVDVGGDVYDFLELDDGRLAVVLGDVTGHGIDAAADMAMAKFVFRSLAREHPDPGDFLAYANDVVCGEIAPGKFITMLYLTVDPATGEVKAAGAGHPRPRLVRPTGEVDALDVSGLALGIEPGQSYEEQRTTIPSGGSLVVYTDGVVEARRDGELYGADRLDAVLAEHRSLPAAAIADRVIEDCRTWAEGELADDCALVVLKRP
ncbi:MAG: SpoIIE family protein phosphatase [Pseudomonadota bacterium]